MPVGSSSRAHRSEAHVVIAALVLASSASCGVDLFHSSHWSTACDVDPGASGCPDADGGGGGAGGMSGAGGFGGHPSPLCGNGTVDPGEECDPTSATVPGCSNFCRIECSGTGEYLRPFIQSCYRLLPDKPLAWGGASNDCVTWGGWLATIDSAEEQAFVASLVSDRTWIGANDKTVEGDFAWDSGEPWGYQNWATGEPSDTLGEDCVELNATLDFAWNDTACADPHVFLCERRPPGM
jgi:cysteine-rich repeat protein